MNQAFLSFSIFFFLCPLVLNAQQDYSGNSVLYCSNNDNKGPSPASLYTCNGEKPSCQAFLIFRSRPPYNSVLTISKLISSDPSELASINSVSSLTVFPTEKEVIVPVNCSCSGQYYQAHTSYVIPSIYDTYFTIANYTYQGLSTCDSLKDENAYSALSLLPGLELRVPLRCACPTSSQIANGTKYLLTYSVTWHDNVPHISQRFNVSRKSILDANMFSEEDPTIFPFTTILIPLQTEPSSYQTIIPNPPIITRPYTSNSGNRRSKIGVYAGIGIATGSALLILCVVLTVAFLYHKHKLDRKRDRTDDYAKEKTKWVSLEDIHTFIADMDRVLKVFEFEELKVATGNFSPEFIIKGSVYRGVFSGKVLAIKKMSADVSKEVNILSKVNHFNLIKLYGICENHGHFYLVYEYMENGSLSNWLHNKSQPEIQSWTQRIQIALDIANGLHYLHNLMDQAYVHRDITSSNILLDGNLRAKIYNFGLARSTDRKAGDFPLTRHIVGTRGYIAPEYIESGSVTPKIDIYAFGVVMLELITGKDVIIMHNKGELLLSAAIILIMEDGHAEAKLSEFLDPNMCVNYKMELALRVAKLCVNCLKNDPANRPSMGEVLSTLSRIHMDSQNWESSYVELV